MQATPGSQPAIAAVGGGPPLPIGKFLDGKQRVDPSWLPVRKSYQQNFTNVAMALHKKKLADAGLRPQYVVQNHRKQVYYGEEHRQTLEEAWVVMVTEAVPQAQKPGFSHNAETPTNLVLQTGLA